MIDIKKNLAAIDSQIQQRVTKKNSDKQRATLVAVSKKQPLAAIREAVDAGQRHFGESYVREAVEKIAAMDNDTLIWHFIGAIQSNKTRQIAEHFHWVHTIDRLKIAQRLSEQRPDSLPDLNVCLSLIHI